MHSSSVQVIEVPGGVKAKVAVAAPAPTDAGLVVHVASQPAGGGGVASEVSLSPATLAALETISVAALPAVALDTATLAALETVQIGSLPAVALDAATLAALETIQVGSIPAVALDAATLAALETISVANFPATEDVTGPTAADAVLTADPLTVGGRASNAVPAAVSADGDVANAWLDRRGASVVRDRVDVGRSRVVLKWHVTASATGDTLYQGVKNLVGVDGAGATSLGVTANKILRLESMYVGVRAGAAAAAFAEISLRSNPAGATLIGSPVLERVPVGVTAAVIGAAVGTPVDLGGMEFTGAETVGVSASAQATTNVLAITIVGYEYDA